MIGGADAVIADIGMMTMITMMTTMIMIAA